MTMNKDVKDYSDEELQKFVEKRRIEIEKRKEYNRKRNLKRKELELLCKERGLM